LNECACKRDCKTWPRQNRICGKQNKIYAKQKKAGREALL